MSSFDPATVRKAVADFVPRRPERFQDLAQAKEVIAELRQKRASYRAVAELLTQHCLPTSKTAIAAFCHQVLGELVRPYRRPNRKRPPAATTSATAPEFRPPPKAPPLEQDRETGAADANLGTEADPPRPRGPRIAHVRMLNPQTS
jgi:hypothetical protein